MKKISILATILILSAIIVTSVIAAEVWGSEVIEYQIGSGSTDPNRTNPLAATGASDNNSGTTGKFFSLGQGGFITLKLDQPVNLSVEIFEATWDSCLKTYNIKEEASVFVSADGTNWVDIGTATNKSSDCTNHTYKTTLALEGQCIQYVKVKDDAVQAGGDYFDLDAVGGNGSCQIKIDVEIDIKPGSDPSCFNNDGHGVIPVAILGSAELDVTTIDPGTVQLEGLAVSAKGKSNKLLAAYEDVNGDGYIDLVIKIEDLDGTFSKGSGFASLTGNLYPDFGGTPIEGIGDICITQ